MDTSKQSHSASSRSTSSRSTSSPLTPPHPAAPDAAASHFHVEMQRALRRQGLAEATRDSYARALRRLDARVDAPLDQLGVPQLKDYFSSLIESHSWSTQVRHLNDLHA